MCLQQSSSPTTNRPTILVAVAVTLEITQNFLSPPYHHHWSDHITLLFSSLHGINFYKITAKTHKAHHSRTGTGTMMIIIHDIRSLYHPNQSTQHIIIQNTQRRLLSFYFVREMQHGFLYICFGHNNAIFFCCGGWLEKIGSEISQVIRWYKQTRANFFFFVRHSQKQNQTSRTAHCHVIVLRFVLFSICNGQSLNIYRYT